jgi:predicted amidohydrolase YtcJ
MRFVNGTVHTLDRNGSVTAGVACSNGRVTAVGPAEALPLDGPEFDLRGRIVLPGLIDAHAHLRNFAESRLAVDLTGARSEAEAAARVAERAAVRSVGSWISGRGWDETRWPGTGAPARGSLDRVAAANPVALTRIDGHALWANGTALRTAGITDETPDPPGGRIVRDSAGRATGLLIDNAARLVRDHMPEVDDTTLADAVVEAVQACLAVGLTGVHEMGVDARTIATYRTLIRDGRFPFRVRAAINGPGRTWQEWRDRGPERYFGDRLSVAAIKLYADGALGSRGAALLAPYSDDPENSGLELAGGADLERWTRDAVTAGFQVCIHAIGDCGNRTVLDAFQRVLADHPGEDRRLRVEHAQILAPADVPRFRALGVIPSMQPTHCTSDLAWAEARLGPERCTYAYAWRSLRDSGVVVAGGSDFPVESPNPMLGISAAVTRRPPGAAGEPWHPEQRLTRLEAVRAFTGWAAYAGFDEAVAGSLEPGKYADLVVLDRDIFTCPEEEIAETRVLLTAVGGEIVYSDASAW